ncbi:hypothetical protein PCE1_000869 [Barthelona sp. PCE]
MNIFDRGRLSGELVFFEIGSNMDIVETDCFFYSLPHYQSSDSYLDSNIIVFDKNHIIYAFFDEEETTVYSFNFRTRTKKVLMKDAQLYVNDESGAAVTFLVSRCGKRHFIAPDLSLKEMNVTGYYHVGCVNIGLSLFCGKKTFILMNRNLECIDLSHLVNNFPEFRTISGAILLSVTHKSVTLIVTSFANTRFIHIENEMIVDDIEIGPKIECMTFPNVTSMNSNELEAIKEHGFNHTPCHFIARMDGGFGIFKLLPYSAVFLKITDCTRFTTINGCVRYAEDDRITMIDLPNRTVTVREFDVKSEQSVTQCGNEYFIATNEITFENDEEIQTIPTVQYVSKEDYVQEEYTRFYKTITMCTCAFIENNCFVVNNDSMRYLCHFRSIPLYYNRNDRYFIADGKILGHYSMDMDPSVGKTLWNQKRLGNTLKSDNQNYIWYETMEGGALLYCADESSEFQIFHFPTYQKCIQSTSNPNQFFLSHTKMAVATVNEVGISISEFDNCCHYIGFIGSGHVVLSRGVYDINGSVAKLIECDIDFLECASAYGWVERNTIVFFEYEPALSNHLNAS